MAEQRYAQVEVSFVPFLGYSNATLFSGSTIVPPLQLMVSRMITSLYAIVFSLELLLNHNHNIIFQDSAGGGG